MPFRLVHRITKTHRIRVDFLSNIEKNEQKDQWECTGYYWHLQIGEEVRSRVLEFMKTNWKKYYVARFWLRVQGHLCNYEHAETNAQCVWSDDQK